MVLVLKDDADELCNGGPYCRNNAYVMHVTNRGARYTWVFFFLFFSLVEVWERFKQRNLKEFHEDQF